MKKLWLGLLINLLSATVLAGPDDPLEIIHLKHRLAVEIMPVIRPLLAPEDALTSRDNQIILRTDARTLAEIKKLLQTLDRPARNVLITVRNINQRDLDAQGYALSGRVHLGDNTATAEDSDKYRASLRLRQRTYSNRLNDTYQLRVIEGQPAFIQTGQVVPYRQRQLYGSHNYPGVGNTVIFRDVSSGFFVVPRLNGDLVTLEIHPKSESLDVRGDGRTNVQRAATYISGQLGEWLTLGGADESFLHDTSGVVYRTGRKSKQQNVMQVKVELVK
jgi:type II secretory pathway component GspD/PulD (secretin)